MSKFAVVLTFFGYDHEYNCASLVGVVDSRDEVEALLVSEILNITRQEAKIELSRKEDDGDNEIIEIRFNEGDKTIYWELAWYEDKFYGNRTFLTSNKGGSL